MIALAHITKYSNIFVRNLQIFKYIRTPTFQWSKKSNIFVFQFFIFVFEYKIFGQKYSNIRIYSNIRYALTMCCVYRNLKFSQMEENIENDNTTKWNVQDISLHFTINATRTTSTTMVASSSIISTFIDHNYTKLG